MPNIYIRLYYHLLVKYKAKISVLIFGYNKEQYIEKVFNSVITQTLNYELYEVVIITNFDVSFLPIERYKNMGLRIIYKRMDGSIDKYIKEGVTLSSGEVICFLDDDEFHNNKLESVMQRFNDIQNLCFYSTYYKTIDSNRTIINHRSPVKIFKERKSKIHIDNYSSKNYIESFISRGGNAYNSCISIKREILLQYYSFLNLINHTEDEILFSFAFDSGNTLMLDNEKLTFMRIHNNNSSHIVRNQLSSVNNRCNIIGNEIGTFCIFVSQKMNFQCQKPKEILLKSQRFDRIIFASLCQKQSSTGDDIKTLLYFKDVSIKEFQISFFLFILFLLSLINKKVAIKLFSLSRGD